MRRYFEKSLLVIASLLAAAIASASDFYTVQTELSRDGKVFAQPTLIVAAERESQVTVSGPDGYTLKLTVVPLPEGQVKLITEMKSEHGGFSPIFICKDCDQLEFRKNSLRGVFSVSKNKT